MDFIIILAAGFVSNKTIGSTTFQNNHPLDLPAGSDLALQRICKFYRKNKPSSQIIVVIDDYDSWYYKCLDSKIDEVILIKRQPNCVESLSKALQLLYNKLSFDSQIIVNPITAIPSCFQYDVPAVVLSKELLIQEDWSSFEITDDSIEFISKHNVERNKIRKNHAFSGIFACRFDSLEIIIGSLNNQEKSDLGSIAYYLYKNFNANFVYCDWWDLGHRATYSISRSAHLVSRSFNSLRYCDIENTITKTSTDVGRIKSEINYLINIDSRLSVYFPRIFEHSLNHFKMEYIPYLSLTEWFLHWDAGENAWMLIFDKIDNFLLTSKSISRPIFSDIKWLYTQKLNERISMLYKQTNFNWKKLFNSRLTVNNIDLQPAGYFYEVLLARLQDFELNQQLYITHGDLCFNNVLADPIHHLIKLIDPRGEMPDTNRDMEVGYGDLRYDIAKLAHSGIFLYDCVVLNLYKFSEKSPNSYQLKIFSPKVWPLTKSLILKLSEKWGITNEQLNTLTANLFFSMIPLHKESLERQIIFMIIGMSIINGTFDAIVEEH